MATEGCTPRSSDELFDFSCTPCNTKDKNSEAVKYCVDCQEYLCENCVDNHNSFSVLAGHTFVGQSKFGQSGSGSKDLPSVPTERCKLHSLKLVDMYCADHDAVGCHVCFTITHRSCQDIHYIPEYIQTNNLTDDARTIEAELEKAINAFGLVLEKKQQEIECNKKARATRLEDIKQYRTELNEILDKLEQASIAEVDVMFRKLDEDYRKSVTQMQECIEKLVSRKSHIGMSQNNQSQYFVNVKMSRCLLSDSVKDITIIPNQGMLRHTFERNSKILHFLKKLDTLAKCATVKCGLYKVSNITTEYVKMRDDKHKCSIWSSCVLDTGDILIADRMNQKIKLVDNWNYKVKDSLQMSCKFSSVCKISSSEAAVCMENETVQFVVTENRLTKTRSLTFDHDCRGLAVLDGQLVIGNDSDQVYIYAMNGDCLKVIKTEKNGNKLFERVRELCVNDDGKMIHIADEFRGIITIDRDGNVLWKYTGQKLKSPWGICTDGHGQVIVSDFSSHNVVQLTPDGKFLGKIISDEYILQNPRAVCFDTINCKLVAECGDELHFIKLNAA